MASVIGSIVPSIFALRWVGLYSAFGIARYAVAVNVVDGRGFRESDFEADILGMIELVVGVAMVLFTYIPPNLATARDYWIGVWTIYFIADQVLFGVWCVCKIII
jgi:hypothetical protein